MAMSMPEGFPTPEVKLGPNFRAKNILESQRYATLNRKESYFLCEQHTWKAYDFDGSPIAQGAGPTPPIPYTQGDRWIPHDFRRPSSPEHLGKGIVDAFTSLIFGEGRWPMMEVPDDDDTEDYAEAVAEAMALPSLFVEARNVGGSTGTVGISWAIHEGRPSAEVHNAKHLFVHEWVDRAQLIPSAVSEVYRYPVDEWDQEKKAYVRNEYWHHRYWDCKQDGYFVPVRVDPRVEPEWVPDMDLWVEHNDGECHLVWIQNLPNGAEVDGRADYDGLYSRLDTIDIIASVLATGAKKNLDPTLVLRVPSALVKFGQVKKGSENALAVGESGDAAYLELSGASITAGLALLNDKKKSALETAQCVRVDADKIAASGVSSVAMKVAYAPMLAQGNKMRTQYGERGVKRLLLGVMRAVRRRPEEELRLPPRKVPKKDAEGEFDLVERRPGKSENLSFRWPAYFQVTSDEKQAAVATAVSASGGKQVISQQTAVEEAAKALDRDPDEEWKRVQAEKNADMQRAAMVFDGVDGAGGQVQVTTTLPDAGSMVFTGSGGAPGKPGAPPGGGAAPPGGGDAPPGGHDPAGP